MQEGRTKLGRQQIGAGTDRAIDDQGHCCGVLQVARRDLDLSPAQETEQEAERLISRLNGDNYLTKEDPDPAVFEDDQADLLQGGGGRDWVFYDPDIDRLQGKNDGPEDEGESDTLSDSPIYDINGDGYISPLDALLVIRDLNERAGNPECDVKGDGYTSPLDALMVIRQLNSRAGRQVGNRLPGYTRSA